MPKAKGIAHLFLVGGCVLVGDDGFEVVVEGGSVVLDVLVTKEEDNNDVFMIAFQMLVKGV